MGSSNTVTGIYFNPRLREGGDLGGKDNGRSSKISIHASAREATFTVCPDVYVFVYFNPRLREGGDGEKLYYKDQEKDFNPRLREGGDCINYQFLHLIQSIPCIDHPSGTSN